MRAVVSKAQSLPQVHVLRNCLNQKTVAVWQLASPSTATARNKSNHGMAKIQISCFAPCQPEATKTQANLNLFFIVCGSPQWHLRQAPAPRRTSPGASFPRSAGGILPRRRARPRRGAARAAARGTVPRGGLSRLESDGDFGLRPDCHCAFACAGRGTLSVRSWSSRAASARALQSPRQRHLPTRQRRLSRPSPLLCWDGAAPFAGAKRPSRRGLRALRRRAAVGKCCSVR